MALKLQHEAGGLNGYGRSASLQFLSPLQQNIRMKLMVSNLLRPCRQFGFASLVVTKQIRAGLP